jgi:hypothetical protein
MDNDYLDIIDYYAALAAQHVGQCVFHAPQPEELSEDDAADCDPSLK